MAQERLAETLDKLIALVEPALDAEGFELVDLEYKRSSKKYLLRIIIDTAGRTDYRGHTAKGSERPNDGVTISDCVRVSKLLSPLFDVEDLIPGAYTLEVSSPGLNRPLTKPAHFRHAVGLKVRVKSRAPVNDRGDTFFIAKLSAADDDAITLQAHGGDVTIPYRLVSKASVEFEF